MICLDTNYLIGALVPDSRESTAVLSWLGKGEVLATPAICWYEFLSGPVTTEQIRVITAILRGGVLPFDMVGSEKAATLFNATQRKRVLRVDAMIAATTINHNAQLATNNLDDFRFFAPRGLKLKKS